MLPFEVMRHRHPAAATFVPSSLYGGSNGYAWDTTNLSQVWQQPDGTTAGAFTSPVGRLTDISGLNNHPNCVVTGSATRPTLQNVSNGMMLFDGSDDKLTCTPCLWAGGAGTVILAVKGASQDGAFLFGESHSSVAGAAWAPGLRTNTSGNMLFYHRNDSFTVTSANQAIGLFDNTAKVYAVVDDGTQVKHYINGTLSSTQSYTNRAALGTTSINQAHLGNISPAGIDWSASVSAYVGSGIVINRALNSTELANAVTWVRNKHGI